MSDLDGHMRVFIYITYQAIDEDLACERSVGHRGSGSRLGQELHHPQIRGGLASARIREPCRASFCLRSIELHISPYRIELSEGCSVISHSVYESAQIQWRAFQS